MEKYIGKNINCDTTQLREDAEGIVNDAVEYKKLINAFFKKLDFTDESKDAWFGDNAELYTSIVLLDKDAYISFGDELKKLGSSLKNYADELEGDVNSNEEICDNDKTEDGDLNEGSDN